MAVRQHLYKLEEEGLVDSTDERRPIGRPARMWRVTERANGRFPDTHADMTVEILRSVRDAFGEDGLDGVIRERTRHQSRLYRDRIPRTLGIEKRVAKLAAVRREEGYMADWSRRSDGSFLLVENHCPICAAARACQGVCREELSLFQAVLGKDVRIERTEHIVSGARRCAYVITPGKRSTRSKR